MAEQGPRREPVAKLEETGFTPIFDGTDHDGLGLRSGLLESGKRRDHRRDHGGSSTEAEYILHMERRATRRFRIEAAIQTDRCNRQQRYPVSKHGDAGGGAVGTERISGGYRRQRKLYWAGLRRTHTRICGAARPDLSMCQMGRSQAGLELSGVRTT